MAKVFSAPGKALIAGGYLVLDPAYNAYVTALSSRMHAMVDPGVPQDFSIIDVKSPQFGGKWVYQVNATDAPTQIHEQTNKNNPFLHATIKTVLNYVQPTEAFNLSITLFSDPGYHTHEHTEARTSANGEKTFLFHTRPIEHVPKTGMGLSAGLVSVVTAALMSYFTGKPVGELRNVIHNIAQIAHCDAQGKIGSGFDVAAAVYGSIVYRRFTPDTIDGVLGRPLDAELRAETRKIVDSEWQFGHEPCSLPGNIRLLMGDVNGGSETPKLVSKVLAWRKSDPNSADVYAELDLANESLISALKSLQNGASESLEPVREALTRIRLGLQKLTRASGADIEPPEQTALLDLCAELPGCLGGIVPGAGGYDAISLLVEEDKIGALKAKSASDSAFANVTWLDLTEEEQGLKEEAACNYEGLI